MNLPTSKPPANIKDQFKKESERAVVYVLVVLGLIYGFFFLPEKVLELFQDRFQQIGKIGGTLAGMGFSAMFATTVGAIMVAC